MTKKTDMT